MVLSEAKKAEILNNDPERRFSHKEGPRATGCDLRGKKSPEAEPQKHAPEPQCWPSLLPFQRKLQTNIISHIITTPRMSS